MPKEKTSTRTKTKRVERKKKGMSCAFSAAPCFELILAIDPNAPKRGLSAYMFFANENRDKVREENPGISFGKSPWLKSSDFGFIAYSLCRSGRQDARREMEGPERQRAPTLRGEGRRRQEAL